MSVFHNNALIGAGGGAAAAAAFQIDRSIRLNSGDSAYLNRTPSSAGNRKTWTWSGWVKRSKLSTWQMLLAAGSDNSNRTFIAFVGSDTATYVDQITVGNLASGIVTGSVYLNPKLRDLSAWYHIVISADLTNSTANDRVKGYINGAEVDVTVADAYENADTQMNNTVVHQTKNSGGSSEFIDGYLAEVNFVDGQALAASDFGEYDSNLVWKPKEYSGTYGTNGFRLTFADNSSDSALGTDSSGNSNTFTVNNLTAKSPGDYDAPQNFGVVTYTGTGSTRSLQLPFQPDLVWIKNRSSTFEHLLFDSVRGATKYIKSNSTAIEQSNSNVLTSFNSDGFTLGNDNEINKSSETYVAWCWKAGGTASSNTDGTITSSVSANPSYGFSIVSYTGSGTSNDSVGHGLGAAPKLVITKNRDSGSYSWRVLTTAIDGSLDRLFLNATNTAADQSGVDVPTSSVFSVGSNLDHNNSGDDIIAYCFADVTGYQKIGLITGTGSDQTITTGFCPQYVWFKASNAAEAWLCIDRTRDPSKTSAATKFLEFNNSNAEVSNVNRIEWLADGFKIVSDGTRVPNVSGTTYVYLAIAGVPSGEEDDSLIDTPTNYTADSGNNAGNYNVLNALDNESHTLSNGNLDITNFGSTRQTHTTILPSSGKWYAEFTCKAAMNDVQIGVANNDGTSYLGSNTDSWGVISINGNSIHNNSQSSYGSSFTTGDTVMVALDLDNGKWYAGKNGTWFNSGDPANGTNPAHSGLSGNIGFAVGSNNTGGDISCNFGQRPFAYTPPTNYLALVTSNLSDPTIADGSTAFEAVSWTGTGASKSLTTSFSPDFIWLKNRSISSNHRLFDTVRGIGGMLHSNTRDNEQTDTNNLTSFDTNGFTVGTNSNTNGLGNEIIAWTWDGGTSTVSNTDGSITSSVRASTTNGFSIVKYVGTGANASVGHGLSAAPDWIIFKDINRNDEPWFVYHSALGSSAYLFLNTFAGATTGQSDFMNSTDPTSSVFSLGNATGKQNRSGSNFLALCWTAVSGFSSFGSYQGNGSSDGPFVFMNFRPRLVALKRSDASGNDWCIYDTARSPINAMVDKLKWNSNGAEIDDSQPIDFLSNGFKARNTQAGFNSNGATYTYAAFSDKAFSLNGGLAR